jgi:excisionase family DNA binding protein
VTDRLLTAKEVADYLAVPETWVRSETRADRIPHVKLRKYRRYRLDDVLAWLEEDSQRGGRRRSSANHPTAPARSLE